jgi:predicted HAD superfamily Cof-like phosphohydrolase
MSGDWVDDIREMYDKFGFFEAVSKMDKDVLSEFLRFRIRFLKEEFTETSLADSPDELVDGLIDLCVVAIGTLELFGSDSRRAWDDVLRANLRKTVGRKENRSNAFGFPDLIKLGDWKAPCHDDNCGRLIDVFKKAKYIDHDLSRS